MERLIESFNGLSISHKLMCVVGGGAVVFVSAAVIRKLLHREVRKVYPRDTVILYQIGRGPYAPSLTPFAVKLETYLRMAKIPYQNVHGFKTSSKGKVPWMEYNGEAIADSTLCIDFLNEKLGIDLNKHLRPAEKGIALSMQVMAEEHLYWCLVLHRWVYENDKSMTLKTFKISKYFMWVITRSVRDMAWKQGMGRHTKEEVTRFMERDIKALSDWLGQKKFLIGDQPCEADCAVFGQLSQMYWQFIGSGYENLLKDHYPNLAQYCERMKTTFWPDWDQCITHGGTKEATV